MTYLEKLKIIINYKGVLATAHKLEAERLFKKQEITGHLDTFEKITIDSILVIWDIPRTEFD